jgi:hypothetical protein
MFLTVHATLGIIIGANLPNPALAFITGFFSHYILDMIPHGDEGKWAEVTNGRMAKLALMDHMALMLNIAALFCFKPDFNLTAPMALAMVGTLLPDYLMAVKRLTENYTAKFWQRLQKIIKPPEKLHHFFHFHIIPYELPFLTGMSLQAIFLAVMWIII